MPAKHSILPALLSCAALGILAACPAKVPEAQGRAGDQTDPGVPVTPPDDPRVVQDTDDLYAIDEKDPSATPVPVPHEPAPGSGIPDETNGVCRLYAPKLPTPECCPVETGFDAELVRELCGHATYLGESLQHSCGYFFAADASGGNPVSIRANVLLDTDARYSTDQHDARMRITSKDPSFASTPVPGVEGAYWSSFGGLRWAFIPGWKNVRQVSWAETACSTDAMAKVLAAMVAAKPPPENAPRPGLIPVARK